MNKEHGLETLLSDATKAGWVLDSQRMGRTRWRTPAGKIEWLDRRLGQMSAGCLWLAITA